MRERNQLVEFHEGPQCAVEGVNPICFLKGCSWWTPAVPQCHRCHWTALIQLPFTGTIPSRGVTDLQGPG